MLCILRAAELVYTITTYRRLALRLSLPVGLRDAMVHHSTHLSGGFMYESLGQLNALENSSLFARAPITLKGPGVCSSVKTAT